MSEKNKLSGKTIPKKELVRELTRENPNYTFNEAYDLINSFLERIAEHCYQGDNVSLRNFGTFSPLFTRKKTSMMYLNQRKTPINRNQDFFTIHFKFSKTVRRQFTYQISIKKDTTEKKHGRKLKKDK